MKTDRSVLEIVGKFLASLRDEEIEKLSDGSVKLALVDVVVPVDAQKSDFDPNPIIELLNSSNNREDAIRASKIEELNGSQLRAILREMDISVSRRDTVDRMRQRIVESTVGFKLTSKAIRGADSPSATNES